MDKIKEAINKLFEGKVDDGGLDNIMEMIEAKVNVKADERMNEQIADVISKKENELNESNTSDLNEYKENLTTTIETYLEIAMNEFVEENKEIIESNVMVEMANTFMSGIIVMMKEHNLNIADSDVDVIADLESKVSTLESRINEKIEEHVESVQQNFEYEKALAIMTKTEKCTLSQREKVISLMESVGCNTIEEFNKKIDFVMNEVVTDNKSFEAEDFDEFELNESTNKTKIRPSGKTKADKLLENM